jgi:hypothetical protein
MADDAIVARAVNAALSPTWGHGAGDGTGTRACTFPGLRSY